MTSRFTRILLPLDGSGFAESALPRAAALAAAHGAELVLVHARLSLLPARAAVDPSLLQVPGDADLEAQAESYLRSQVRRAAEYGAPAPRSLVLHGHPVETIAEAVVAEGADLVVLTTHGRGALGRAVLGGVAHGLLHAVHVPLLLLRPPEESAAEPSRFRQILVPVDADGFAESILQPLACLVPPRDEVVTVLGVVTPPFLAGGEAEGALSLTTGAAEALTRSQERATEAYVAQVAAVLRAAGYAAVRGRVVIGGSVAGSVLEVAREIEADLIAMPTHGRRGARRFLVGSVTDKVVRGFHGALLVQWPEAGETTPA